ncbi:hypothetical protein GQ42DRAFT_112543, partial [Ramicandelaber brevisporus]
LRRGRTLVRPDRQQPGASRMISAAPAESRKTPWVIYSKIVSFWAPSFILAKVGLKEPAMQQAWREKIGLCFIVILLCAFVVYITMFLQMTFCPQSAVELRNNILKYGDKSQGGMIGWLGDAYTASPSSELKAMNIDDPTGQDVTPFFVHEVIPKECTGLKKNFAATTFDPCTAPNDCSRGSFTQWRMSQGIERYRNGLTIGYEWKDVKWPLVVMNGTVLNLKPYTDVNPKPLENDVLDQVLRTAEDNVGHDLTRYMYHTPETRDAINCIRAKYKAGSVSKETVGCFSVNLFNIVALVVIGSIIFARFFMALTFSWFLSWQLVRRPSSKKRAAAAATAAAAKSTPWSANKAQSPSSAASGPGDDELYTVMLVTCYSEGESSIRTTVESLAGTTYPDSQKLLFIVADGIITGSGNDRSTPDICIDLIEQDAELGEPQPCSYIAVAAGSKQHNMAKVYAGHFIYKEHRVPTVVIVKCGTPAEEDKPKPGNRGKRDSQVILMNFFSRVIHNDRMSPLDFDLFTKIHKLMGVTPDHFEIVLMVDADTKVYPDSLQKLVNCMQNDEMIMGLCGETKIANKRDSWVTAIQVFEYYISHHLGKAFESVFGGVTCLPGCFCMYRLKARKGDNEWVPILTNPEILQEYQQNVVETLHEKNLLLLGEDRFLSTLMLRTFPKRKMVFMPQAICKTVVPDTFKVLLSQRRRWINSTIHNLLELVLVRNLCGTFCFSMQFVILMELIGTTVLPAAIVMTYVLIVSVARATYNTLASFLPLIMLVMVLFLPGILILITTRKWIYIGWMLIYLVALPVWNFVLPVYAYWHFDDFSWGETRKVDGEAKGHDHSRKSGEFDGTKVPLRRWEDYERRRLRGIRKQ